MAEETPMMRQYREIKKDHEDAILFFRLGDFYEMFDEDAKTASRELDLVLTTRDRSKEKEDQVPMCGVPFHSSEAYIARLIQKGYKVAICEQMEDPALAKGLVERDIIRIVTPGTVIDSSMLDEGKSNYLAAVCYDALGSAVAFCDISTGELAARSFPADEKSRALNELARFNPSEAVLNAAAGEDEDVGFLLHERLKCLTETENARFDYMQSTMRIAEQFGTDAIDRFGLSNEAQAVCAIGALLGYIKDTQKTDMSHLNRLDFYSDGKYMELDIQTIRNLELVSSMHDGSKKGSLLWAMDKTKTPMGSRLLRSWVSRPLLSPAAITRRSAAVRELYDDNVARGEVMLILRGVGDIERLIAKIVYGTANARDLLALASSAAAIPDLKRELGAKSGALLTEILNCDDIGDLVADINAAIADDAPFSVREGEMIRDGFDPEVDRLRGLLRGSTQALADIEAREKARTGKKLKVGYNKVFGYYIEIPKAQTSDVPDDYIRKQTLVNGERYITEELKNLEAELLGAKDKVADLEYRIFNDLRLKIAGEVLRVQSAARAVATLDVICSLAECAVKNSWCMPDITADGVIEITDGRHPVVEQMQKNTLFVPNDVRIGGAYGTTAIITGPNMAGKSTYMRSVALITLMAQMGSFVPAKSASIGIVDRVFTRIGASDDLAAGKSTFMVEMSEVAEILKNATKNSLILLDEIGRGTSTYDGMAIARAVVEFCADPKSLGAKTLFATHYHELTVLENELAGVKNYNISAKKRGGDIIFLRKIVPGGADDSYGIEVANLAGVPKSVISRANKVLSDLIAGKAPEAKRRSAPEPLDMQVSFESAAENEVIERIRRADINTMTPLEALNLLYSLKKEVRD